MLSIVIPIYNEEEIIPELLSRLKNSSHDWGEYEIIFVNDGSVDRSCQLLTQASSQENNLRLIEFSRNFGHQIAVSAGLNYAKGDCVAIIDGDLQDPPEMIKDFLAKWREGYKVVYAIRKARKENIFKRMAYNSFYRILRYLAEIEIPLDAGDFCLMDRKVVDVINSMPERNRFVRGLRSWAGFSSVGVEYEREKRFAGEPKYTLRKLIHLALDGMIGFSSVPLKASTYFGFIIAFFSFLIGVLLIVLKLTVGVDAQGWTSIILIIFFMGGVQLIVMGMLGEYIGRIYKEVQHRPLYIVKEKIGFSNASEHE